MENNEERASRGKAFKDRIRDIAKESGFSEIVFGANDCIHNIANMHVDQMCELFDGMRFNRLTQNQANPYGIRLFRTKSALSAACEFIRSLNLPEDELPIALGSWENIAGDN